MSTYVKSYIFFQLKKKELFDLNIFSEISSFYGNGMLEQVVEEDFETAYAWLWYNPEIHIVTHLGRVYRHATPLWNHRDCPIFDMGDGGMLMTENVFREFIDLEINYEDNDDEDDEDDDEDDE